MEENSPPAPKRDQPWAWAAAVAAALVILVVGAIVGMTTSHGTAAGAPTAAASSGAAETTVTSIPPTQTVPEATATGPTETGPVESGATGATTSAGATTGPSTEGLATWPPGKDGYTVVLVSVAQSKGEDAAIAKARKAQAAGLPDVGILSSSEYSTLNPGFWVVFSGIYDDLTQAAAQVGQARTAGFADAYPRNVAP